MRYPCMRIYPAIWYNEGRLDDDETAAKAPERFYFQKTVRRAETKELLIHLLNAIFESAGGKRIDDLTIIGNTELSKELIDDKTGRLDIRAETSDNEQVNIEVQLEPQKHMDKRTLFYWSKMYAESIKAGEKYNELKRTITINLLDFHYLPTGRFHSTFHLYADQESFLPLTDAMEIHFIEYPKFRRTAKNFHEPLHRWLLFLEDMLPEDLLEELMSMDPVIKKAEDRLEWLSGDEETRRLYEAREFSKYERNSIISSAKEEGEEIGKAEGKAEAKEEIARNLLALGMDVKKIAKATGLSEEAVKKL